MNNGVLKLKEMKIMFAFIRTILLVIYIFFYFCLYSDYKNICDNIPWERKNIKFIGLIGPMGRSDCLSTFTVHLCLVGRTIRGLDCAYQVDANS